MPAARGYGRVSRQLLDPGVHVTVDPRLGLELDEDGEGAHRFPGALERVGKVVQHRERLVARWRRGFGCTFEPLDGGPEIPTGRLQPSELRCSLEPEFWYARRRLKRGRRFRGQTFPQMLLRQLEQSRGFCGLFSRIRTPWYRVLPGMGLRVLGSRWARRERTGRRVQAGQH